MTKERYEKYAEIKSEVDKIKDFLSWCGQKHRCSGIGQYPTRVIGRKVFISVGRAGFGPISNTEIVLPQELQEGIINLIEQYVERREKEMEEI